MKKRKRIPPTLGEEFREFVAQNIRKRIDVNDVPSRVALYCTLMYSTLSQPQQKWWNEVFGIDLEKIATSCLKELGISISEFRDSVSLGVVDANKIKMSLRGVKNLNNKELMDATLQFDASFLIRRVRITRNLKVSGVT